MKTLLIVLIIFFISHFSYASSNCKSDAEKYLENVAYYPKFKVANYTVKKSTGNYAAESTEIYMFLRTINDTWKIELVSSDCFLIGINFEGDL